MTDTKTDSKADIQELGPFEGLILFGVACLIGGKIIKKLSHDNKEDENQTSQYNTELEALRRLFREGLL